MQIDIRGQVTVITIIGGVQGYKVEHSWSAVGAQLEPVT